MSARNVSGPAAKGPFSRDFPDDDTGGSGRVQSWLNRLPWCRDGATDQADQFDQPVHQDLSSGWHPHQLPVAPIPLDIRSPKRQRISRRGQSRPIPISSDKFESSSRVTAPRGDSLATGSDKENRKRLTYPDTHHSVSDDLRFERRPRRKTRHSRYDSEKRDGDKRPRAKNKTEEKQRDRTKNHIRSSRDIMRNFASSAISNNRITLRPDLKPGLFLNSQSSISAENLSFNEMHFMRDQDESRRGGICDGNTTSDEFDNREREASFVTASAGRASTIFHTENDHYAQNGRHGGFERQDLVVNNRAQLLHGSRDRNRENPMLERVLPRQDRPGTENRASSPYSLENPGSILEALIETGVFNDTGILARHLGIGKEKQPNPGPKDPAEGSEAHTHTIPSYQDEGTLLSLSSLRRLFPKDHHPGMDPYHQEDAKNGRLAPSEASPAGQLNSVLPFHTHDSGHVNFNPGPCKSPYLPESEGIMQRKSQEHPPGRQSTARSEHAETENGCDLGDQFRSTTETLEGGHYYIPSHQLIHDAALGLDSTLWPSSQPLLHARPPPPWQQNMDHRQRHDWQFDSNASTSIQKAPIQGLHGPYLEVESLSLPDPRPPPSDPELSKDPSAYERVEAYKENLDTSDCFGGAVNMKDYIERIEAEVLAKWNEAEPLPDGNVVDNDRSLSELEPTAPRGHFSKIESQGQPRESTPHLKDPFVGGQHPHIGTGCYSARPAVDRSSLASEEEMLAFWGPNRFL
ncbi:hypothetical protein ACJZ2D_003678 [Fusarium nematophilum]